MPLDQTKWVWKNGQVVAWDQALLHTSAHALHYGTGVFEGIRCYETAQGAALFRLNDHLNRLHASARTYGFEIPYSLQELSDATCESIRRNGFGACYVRPLCYLDSADLGIRASCPVSVVILAWPWRNHFSSDKITAGTRVTVSRWVKFHSSMIPTTAKSCGQYLNALLAVNDAANRGFDEALLLDTHGNIAEGAVENIFLVCKGNLRTNDERSSILPGITRASVIEIARGLGIGVEIGTLTLEELLTADEAFFTGTAAEVVPIREVDGTKIGCGSCGTVTARIMHSFRAATSGQAPQFRHWLHFVTQPSIIRQAAGP